MKGASIPFATKLLINKFMLILNSVFSEKLVFYFQKKTAIFAKFWKENVLKWKIWNFYFFSNFRPKIFISSFGDSISDKNSLNIGL